MDPAKNNNLGTLNSPLTTNLKGALRVPSELNLYRKVFGSEIGTVSIISSHGMTHGKGQESELL